MTSGRCSRCSGTVYRQAFEQGDPSPPVSAAVLHTEESARASRDRFKREPGAVSVGCGALVQGLRRWQSAHDQPWRAIAQQTSTADKNTRNLRAVCMCGRYRAAKCGRACLGGAEPRLVAVLRIHSPCMSELPAPPPRAAIAGLCGLFRLS